MIQSGNQRGARDPARELVGAGDTGNALVQNTENLQTKYTSTSPNSTGTGPEPEFRSGPTSGPRFDLQGHFCGHDFILNKK